MAVADVMRPMGLNFPGSKKWIENRIAAGLFSTMTLSEASKNLILFLLLNPLAITYVFWTAQDYYLIYTHAWLFIIFAIPHIFYAWIWYDPSQFTRLVKPIEPCRAMSSISVALKALQLVAVIPFFQFQSLSWSAILMIGFGQYLNFRVYSLLGEIGVYYGHGFGHQTTWVTEFPFSTIRHPQYIGCLLSIAGICAWLPKDFVIWWMALYEFTAWVESHGKLTRKKSTA